MQGRTTSCCSRARARYTVYVPTPTPAVIAIAPSPAYWHNTSFACRHCGTARASARVPEQDTGRAPVHTPIVILFAGEPARYHLTSRHFGRNDKCSYAGADHGARTGTYSRHRRQLGGVLAQESRCAHTVARCRTGPRAYSKIVAVFSLVHQHSTITTSSQDDEQVLGGWHRLHRTCTNILLLLEAPWCAP